jgi:hypothetical protein
MIATVFPVNPVFDYPQYGKYGIYGFYFFRISIIDNQALKKRLILPTDISRTSTKVRGNAFQNLYFLKINSSYLNTQQGGSGGHGGNPATSATYLFLTKG